jgi:tetratricopeptide (TPR) repeat protein
MRLEDFMAERWIYIAAIGFSVGLAEILMTMIRHYRRTGIVTTGVVLLLFGSLTFARNQVYASPVLLWEDAAKKSPEKYRPFINLSSAYMENGDAARAIESAQEAIKQWNKRSSNSKDILTAYINLTTAAYGDDPGQAGEVLSAIAAEASQNVDYYSTLGSFSMNAGKYQDAIASFKKALALSPQSAAFLFLIGECYENIGQKQTAQEYFVRATTVIPQTAKEYMGQGEAFSKLGDYQKASDRFHESIRTDPMDVSMRVYFATILQKNQYLDQALEQFSLAVKISPGYAPAYKGMGQVMLEKGKYEMATKYLDRALALLPLKSPERKSVLALMETAKKSALEHSGSMVVR